MIEVLEFSFSEVNIISTFLLCFSLFYWLTVLLGMIDLDMIDVDLDLDVDADAPDAPSIGWFNAVLAFFNLGQIPFMVFFTFLALPLWMISLIANHNLGVDNFLMSLAVLAPSFFVSLFIAKYMTLPFVKLFSKIKEDETPITLVGKPCVATLKLNSDSMGQVEVLHDGNAYRINAKTSPGITLSKGESGLVIQYNQENKYYIIEPY